MHTNKMTSCDLTLGILGRFLSTFSSPHISSLSTFSVLYFIENYSAVQCPSVLDARERRLPCPSGTGGKNPPVLQENGTLPVQSGALNVSLNGPSALSTCSLTFQTNPFKENNICCLVKLLKLPQMLETLTQESTAGVPFLLTVTFPDSFS